MPAVNRVHSVTEKRNEQPAFGSGNCLFGTIGKSEDGELFIWSSYCSQAVSLTTGQTLDSKAAKVTVKSLVPGSTVTLVVNNA